jgi:hypothetical protein
VGRPCRLVPRPAVSRSAVLVFRPNPQQDRFWEVPAEPERRPYFLLSFLELMGDWQECYAWRHLGSWPESAEPLRINDVVEWQILKGLGLPLGTAEVVRFERAELDKLVTLMFSTTIFGGPLAKISTSFLTMPVTSFRLTTTM